ncbi:hypothetical protein NQX30_00740 [Candidatus Persebacteraceae bacterium Df01]|uniref:Uncharacterized protein n=1 Tax=Candidatus Doriopsillibacter californiensis TaxID=2970740 RepID=A0ABT7QJQ7_9GAMM|nr:hypothetical protein [Candidatus Persebacteraceae bacterium Df01]
MREITIPNFFPAKGRGVLADLIATRSTAARHRYGLNLPRRQELCCDLFRPPSGDN